MMAGKPDKSAKAIHRELRSMPYGTRQNISHMGILLKLILVAPATKKTNAVSERSASALRHVKNYLRSTLSQVRLNNLLVLHCHIERTDVLYLPTCLQTFIDAKPQRDVFGKFDE